MAAAVWDSVGMSEQRSGDASAFRGGREVRVAPAAPSTTLARSSQPVPAEPAAAAPSASPEVRTAVAAALSACAHLEGPLLPVLHDLQHRLGHVPREALPLIAEALHLSRAEVHGVVSFYPHFRQQPAAACVVQVCRAESCQAMGAEALLAHARERLGCSGQAHASPDGRYTVEPVYCLGLCASSPALTLAGRPMARMTVARLDAAIAAREAHESLNPPAGGSAS